MDIPAAPGAACNLLGTVSLVNAGRPNLQQQLTAQPLPSGGDPANAWGTPQAPSAGASVWGGVAKTAPAMAPQGSQTLQVQSALRPVQAPALAKPVVGAMAR
jgi:hypothetical protein